MNPNLGSITISWNLQHAAQMKTLAAIEGAGISHARDSGPDAAVLARPRRASSTASLRDDRTVFIYGERVKDATTHPAFRNTARMVARLTLLPFSPATLVRGGPISAGRGTS